VSELYLHLDSVFIYPYFQVVILSDQCSCRFLWTWLLCRTWPTRRSPTRALDYRQK